MQPKPWSISSLDRFDNCPKQYNAVVVAKRVKDDMGAAADYGNYIHEHFEHYLRDRTPLPTTNPMHFNGERTPAYYQAYCDYLLTLPGEHRIEMKLALNKKLEPCDFWSPDVWVRGKADFLALDGVIARGIDHKTGKRKPSRQMTLMALLLFHHFPEIEEVRTAFFWLKVNERDTGKYVRADIPAMWNQFVTSLNQYKLAYHTDKWQARESGLCHGWCPVTDCAFWKPKRPPRR